MSDAMDSCSIDKPGKKEGTQSSAQKLLMSKRKKKSKAK